MSRINENKLWMKIIFEKKVGGFTKLMEAMSMLGIEVVDISVTTTKGAILITSCIEVHVISSLFTTSFTLHAYIYINMWL